MSQEKVVDQRAQLLRPRSMDPCVRRDDGKVESKRPPNLAAVSFLLSRRLRVIAVAIAIVAVEAVGIVVHLVILVRGLIEQPLPRAVATVAAVRAPARRADV